MYVPSRAEPKTPAAPSVAHHSGEAAAVDGWTTDRTVEETKEDPAVPTHLLPISTPVSCPANKITWLRDGFPLDKAVVTTQEDHPDPHVVACPTSMDIIRVTSRITMDMDMVDTAVAMVLMTTGAGVATVAAVVVADTVETGEAATTSSDS